MNKWLTRLGIISLLLMGIFVPNYASASTESDWKLSASLTPVPQDSATKLAMNVTRCRNLFDISSGEVTFVFTLNKDIQLSENAEFSIKFAKGNVSCSKDVLEQQPDEGCISITNNKALTATSSPIEVRRKVTDLSSAANADTCENLNETSYLYLIVKDPTATNSQNIYTVTYMLDFRTKRPEAPTGLEGTAGGESISLKWKEAPDVLSYKIYYGADGTMIKAGDIPENIENASTATSASTSTRIKNKISAEKTYMITVTSVDSNGNESRVGEVISVETIPSKDFWDSYREEHADVDGGFCFIATAAYGSTQEPHVALLRKFRDDVLMQSAPGRAFVKTYYELSPPVAYFIGQHETARAVTRTLLWPLYGFAALYMYAPIAVWALFALLFGAVGYAVYRRRSAKKAARISHIAPILAAAIAAGACFAPASAQAESPVDMMAEIKAGPYYPDGLGKAFDTHFGDNTGFMVEAEYDWQFWRGVGSLGLGFHLGYGNIEGKSIDQNGEKSIDGTKLHWLPLRISLVYRFDYLWQRFNIPLTIYAKAGFDYMFWWAVDGSDSISVSDDKKDGYGGTFGFHVVAGIAFVLDWLAPDMEKSFDVEWGINNSYIFAEYIYNNISNFGADGAFDLGCDATFNIGIGLEF